MKNNKQYLIRLDDACPTMDAAKWGRMESLLDKYGVKPMIGIVPDCKDETIICQEPDSSFWAKARNWQSKGYAIALHGYDHVYSSDEGLNGLNPMWKRSEFAGIPLDEQRKKIREGIKVLKGHDLNCDYFFAPSHTFDENTLEALRKESDIRIVSDTIALRPYRYKDFIMIPQIVSIARNLPLPGVYTFCYHPNTMIDADFDRLEAFLSENVSNLISFQDLEIRSIKEMSVFDKILKFTYFLYHRIRNPK